MRKGTGMLVLKVIAASILTLILSIAALLYVVGNGVPFIEGDNTVTTGEAYNFRIGMTKPETFKAIQQHYNKKEYYLRTLWLKKSEINNILEPFENTELKEYRNSEYGEHKILINKLNKITLPLEYGQRWDIRMPADWVNSIYLTFENDNLIEIQKSRWLFERP